MAKHEAGNGNNLKIAFEQAEKERREREIKAIEKHLSQNGESGTSESVEEDKLVQSEPENVFRTVPPQVAQRYAKKTPKDREKYLKNSMIAQQMQAERENRERDERIKKEEERKTQKRQRGKRGSGGSPSLNIQSRPKPRIKIKSTPEQIRVVPPDELAPPAQPESAVSAPESEPVAEAQKTESKFEYLSQAEVDVLLAHPVVPQAEASPVAGLEIPDDELDKHDGKVSAVKAETENEIVPDVFRSNRKNTRDSEVMSEPQFTSEQMAKIDWIKTRIHELNATASVRELTTDEFADRANLELELEDIYGPFQEQQEPVSFEDRKGRLNRRAGELDAKAKEYGIKFENFVRNIGEDYRKLPLKYKIGVAGALLGLNIATGGASTLVTLLTSTAMLGQRALGSAATYALLDGLLEKKLARKEKERGSERTKSEKLRKRGLSAAAALAVFTGLPGYAVKEGFDAIGGGGMLKALGALMGISPATTELPPTTPVPTGASAGHSVEEAAKIMQQAKEQLAKEITARNEIKAGLDQVKQQIVEEKARVAAETSTPREAKQALKTAVEKLTKVSATADAKFEMPKHADFSIHEDDTTISPYDVTPTDQSGADDTMQVGEESQSVAEPEAQQPIVEETPRTWQEKIVPEDTSPAAIDQQVPTETPIESDGPVVEKSIISNQVGLAIPVAEPHIYAGTDAGHTFAFGGTPTERENAILQYLRENPNKVVFGPDNTNTYRIPWHLVDGKLTPGSPMRTNGLFGFLSTWMKPPGPEDLEKIIK